MKYINGDKKNFQRCRAKEKHIFSTPLKRIAVTENNKEASMTKVDKGGRGLRMAGFWLTSIKNSP